MKFFKNFCCVFFLLISSNLLLAQQTRSLTGKVISAQDNLPLSGASVSVKGSAAGTTTSDDGSFSLSVPNGKATLIISYIGYKSTERVVAPNESNININIDANNENIEEVVVTALGVKREKKALTYAVQSIKVKDILEVRDPNIVNTLQGKVAGAVINQGSGGLGSRANLMLRGNRSLSNNSGALYVIDGVPINNFSYNSVENDFGNGFTGTDGTNTINPDDIESLTVLRGASASALYGSAAGNGVVVITTKKGRPGKIAVTVNTGFAQESVFGLPAFQNKYGQGIGGTINSSLGSSWGPEMQGQAFTNHLGQQATYSAQPNNVRDFFNRGNTFNSAVGVSGGNEKTQTYLSYSNTTANGVIPNNELDKHLVNLRITNRLTDKLTLDGKINYMHQEIRNTPYSGENNAPVFNLYQMPRNISSDVAKDYTRVVSGRTVPTQWPSTLNSIYQNPYWAVNNIMVNQDLDRVAGFLTLNYQLTPWLAVMGRANNETSFAGGNSSIADGTLLHGNSGGRYSQQVINATFQWYDVMLLGTKDLNKDFTVEYQAGAIYTDNTTKLLFAGANGLSVANRFNLNFASARETNNALYKTRSNAVYARSTISFKKFLFLDGSFRNDWTSTLPAPHSYNYPSIGLGAVISDMVKLPSFISFLKLSASKAQVGNTPGPYQLTTGYFYSGLPSLGAGLITRSGTKALTDLKPEITKSNEASANIRFLKDRLSIEGTIYKTNSYNQILYVQLPAATGFYNQLINAGNIQNQGFEVVLSAIPVAGKNFNWTVDFNVARNTNKLVQLSETVKELTGFIRYSTVNTIEGKALGEIYGYGWDRNMKGDFLIDKNGLPIGTDDPKYLGNINPKASLGLSNSFGYKNISLRVLIDGKVGGTIISGNEGNLAFDGIAKVTEQNRDGNWVLPGTNPEGQQNTKQITAQDFWTSASLKRYGTGEFFAYDATNFRIREISLGYRLPIRSSALKSAQVSAFARNLLFLYRGSSKLDIPGLGKRKLSTDPDMVLGSSPNGSDYGVLPSNRMIGVNLQLSF